MRRLLASAAIVGITTIGISFVGAGTASAAAVCPKLAVSGTKYQWETIGTSFTCASAKHWVQALINDPADTSSGKVTLTNGPKGYHCFATSDDNGKASAGQCYKGTAAFPKAGFAWLPA